MKYVNSIKRFLPITLVLVLATSCNHLTKIPNPKFYAEIPFQDCPEAVYIEALTHNTGTVSCEEWKQKRPLMIMIDPDGKKEIFNGWSEACRYAGDKNCNVKLESVRTTIEALDKIAGTILKPIGK